MCMLISGITLIPFRPHSSTLLLLLPLCLWLFVMMVWCRPCPWLTVCGWEHLEHIKNGGDGWMSGRNTTWPLTRALAGTVGIYCESVCVHVRVCVPESCCYLWAQWLRVLSSVLRHIACPHALTPLAFVNIYTESLCWVSRGLYCLENARWSSIHLPSKRRDVNNITTLSAGECWATRRGKVLQREMDGESEERVTQLEWTFEWQRGQSVTIMQVTSPQQKRQNTPTSQREREGERV